MNKSNYSIGAENEYNRITWIINKLQEVSSGKRILDAGAGELRYKPYCSHLEYVSQDFCQYKGNGDHGLQTGSWDTSGIDIVSDITRIPVPDNSFDVILCSEVFEHIENPRMALKEFSRILRKDGELIITAPFCSLTHMAPYHYYSGFNIYWYRNILKEFGFQITEESRNGNYFSYLAQEIRRLEYVSNQYSHYQINTEETALLHEMLALLSKIDYSDNNSDELLCFGYGITAKKHIDDISFIIPSNEIFDGIFQLLDYLLSLNNYSSAIRIIIVNSCNSVSYTEKLISYEKSAPDTILLINTDNDFDISHCEELALSYSNSYCYICLHNINDIFNPDFFYRLQPDDKICSLDKLKFIQDKYTYISTSYDRDTFQYSIKNELPMIRDYRESAGSIDGHYFFQDIYVASKIHTQGIKHVYDIGSRVDGFISHLLSMSINVTMIDIRPLSVKIDNLNFVEGDAINLSGIDTGSIKVLSCLHALEHFGLGRYGDPIDFNGWRKALTSFKRVLAPEGLLFISVPIGIQECVMFNAHRIFNPMTIISNLAPTLKVIEFVLLHEGKNYVLSFDKTESMDEIQDSIWKVCNEHMGAYDCGIFTFVNG